MTAEHPRKWGVLRIVAQAIFELVCVPIAAFLVPFVVPFARWDREPTTFTGGAPDNGPPIVRGDLPWWASLFGTFDERLPGGMYEPTVVKVYNRFGRYWCSLYWLIVRNRMFGLAKAMFGKPIAPDEQPAGMTWRTIGRLRVGWGTAKYRATPQANWQRGPFVEVAKFTVRLVRE